MGVSSKSPDRPPKRATVTDAPEENYRNIQQPAQPRQEHQITAQQASAQASSDLQSPGPGFQHTVTNRPGSISGINPSTVQQYPQLHSTPGFSSVPAPGGAFLNRSYGAPSPSPSPQLQFGTYYNPAPPATGIATAPIAMPPMVAQHPGMQQPPMLMQTGQAFQQIPAQQVIAQPAIAPYGQAPYGQAPYGQAGAPVIGQPGFPGFQGQPQFIGNGAPGSLPPGNPYPDIMGVGKTAGEVTIEQLNMSANTDILEPQDIKPADENPSRMYFCRELDREWTMRSRFELDNLPIRWYVTAGGAFYAIRLDE